MLNTGKMQKESGVVLFVREQHFKGTTWEGGGTVGGVRYMIFNSLFHPQALLCSCL